MATSLDCLELCRLCLVKEQVNVPIFKDGNDMQQIFLKITACLPVKVSLVCAVVTCERARSRHFGLLRPECGFILCCYFHRFRVCLVIVDSGLSHRRLICEYFLARLFVRFALQLLCTRAFGNRSSTVYPLFSIVVGVRY